MLFWILVALLLIGLTVGLALRLGNAKKIRLRLLQSNPTTVLEPSAKQSSLALQTRGGQLFKQAVEKYLPSHLLAKMHVWLGQAGLAISETELLMMHAIALVTGSLIGALIGKSFLAFLVGGLISMTLPMFLIRNMARKRLKLFDLLFGDAITLMTTTIRSGFALRQAMQVVAQEMPNPMAEEFEITLAEINMGLSQDQALKNLAERIPNDDLDLFVTAVLIQSDIGGNLGSVLEKIGATIRERVSMRNEIAALTAQGKMSGLMVGALPFLIVGAIYFMNPDYISVLFNTDTGHKLLLGSVVMEGIGALVIRKMIQVDA